MSDFYHSFNLVYGKFDQKMILKILKLCAVVSKLIILILGFIIWVFQEKVNNCIEKWYARKVIDSSWKSFVSCDSPSAGKMYGLVKTHKVNNPVRIITSGCDTAVENLSIFVEKVLYKEVERIPSRIKDAGHTLDIIDNLSDSA